MALEGVDPRIGFVEIRLGALDLGDDRRMLLVCLVVLFRRYLDFVAEGIDLALYFARLGLLVANRRGGVCRYRCQRDDECQRNSDQSCRLVPQNLILRIGSTVSN